MSLPQQCHILSEAPPCTPRLQPTLTPCILQEPLLSRRICLTSWTTQHEHTDPDPRQEDASPAHSAGALIPQVLLYFVVGKNSATNPNHLPQQALGRIKTNTANPSTERERGREGETWNWEGKPVIQGWPRARVRPRAKALWPSVQGLCTLRGSPPSVPTAAPGSTSETGRGSSLADVLLTRARARASLRQLLPATVTSEALCSTSLPTSIQGWPELGLSPGSEVTAQREHLGTSNLPFLWQSALVIALRFLLQRFGPVIHKLSLQCI